MEEHVLKARREIFGEDSPDVLMAMANLAITKRDRGKLCQITPDVTPRVIY